MGLTGRYRRVDTTDMPERSRKRPRDLNSLAKSIVDDATRDEPRPKPEERAKNAAAVELGRLGGLKGGKARAAKLSAEERSDIAKRAAAARWGRTKNSSPSDE
jgi:hypothetical protein